ncbi:hypothetical protein CRUP_000739, partial [Coryphaenoides rupestris]
MAADSRGLSRASTVVSLREAKVVGVGGGRTGRSGPMTAWIVLPVSLSAFSITGIWIVYAMAVMNHHVCPVENWSYNVTCTEEMPRPGFPKTCCTIQDIPLI